MECPICGAELEHYDTIIMGHNGPAIGDIYKCPSGAEQNGTCDSELFRAAGSFYAYRNDGVLHEGYPC